MVFSVSKYYLKRCSSDSCSLQWRQMSSSTVTSQCISLSTVCSTICSGWRKRKHQSSLLLALCEGNPPFAGGFPSQRASNKELWCFLLRQPEQIVEHDLCCSYSLFHYSDVIMSAMASQIKIVYSTVYSGAYQRKHQSSASRAFVRGIHRSPVNSPHKGPVTRKMFPLDDVMMSRGIPITDIPIIVREASQSLMQYHLTMLIMWYREKKLKAVGKIVLNQSHQENMAKRELCVLWKYADVYFINLFRNILVLLCHQQSWQGLSSLRVRIKEHFIPSQCIVKYTVSTPQCC